MSTKYWWNDTDRVKPKYWEVNLSHWQSVHDKHHTDWPGTVLDPPQWKAGEHPPEPRHGLTQFKLNCIIYKDSIRTSQRTVCAAFTKASRMLYENSSSTLQEQDGTCTGKKLKCALVQALRLCTGRTAHRASTGIALPFHEHDTIRGWGVSVTHGPLFTPGKDPVPIVREAGWAPGPVWTGAENLASTGTRSLDRPGRSQSLYWLRYPAQEPVQWGSKMKRFENKPDDA